jgi:hypothetical protein
VRKCHKGIQIHCWMRYNIRVVEDQFMNLSEFIEEFREHEIYETDPQDWRGYLADDDYWVPDPELVY